MNFSRFFIDRPIFAAVISLLIFMGGALSLTRLPISEYPEVVPPSVSVRAQFPGANPGVIAQTVAAPLEEQINGVEDMLYMSSQSTTDGTMVLTVTFKLGTDPDQAQQLVQNRVSQALPRLPEIVRLLGVTTTKGSGDLTMVVHLSSPGGTYDINYMHNYAVLNVKDRLSRLEGVGMAEIFGGGPYAMRIWLDPEKLAARNIAANDVAQAVREQNTQVAAGTIGGQPVANPLAFELPVNAQGRLSTPEEFGDIILKAAPNGTALVRLKDVARIELGASSYGLRSLLNNKQAVGIAIFQASGSNALAISSGVRKTMEELSKSFPADLKYDIIYDPTQFVSDSIDAVIHTLLEAVLLVVLVVILFLQRWRAAIIPLLAVPVSIVGTFLLMDFLGFSINNLTLFGLVLAIGIVVDDAIVVVENVERNIEDGLSPRDATVQAMKEVTGPIIATSLVLCAVFIPISFISGLTGLFYQQFALTIAISTIISTINSLTLSPAMSALLLQAPNAPKDWLTRTMDHYLGGFFERFNRAFLRAGNGYQKGVTTAIRRRSMSLSIYGVLIVLAAVSLYFIPQGYVPTQDKQYLVAFTQLPPGSSLDRTEAVIKRMSDIALQNPGVENAIAFPGLSINGFVNSSSAGIVFLGLKDFDQRKGWQLYGPAIAGQLMGPMSEIKDGFVAVFPPPAVNGLGAIGGFKLQIQDRSEQGDKALYNVMQAVQGQAYQNPALTGIFSSFNVNVPQLYADIDRNKAKQLDINLNDVFSTLQVYLASLYINDFNQFGRTYQVIAQADAPFRDTPEDLLNLKVRSQTGAMVPLGSILKVNQSFGPDTSSRYNLYRAADLNAGAAPGIASGQAQAEMVKILETTLPPGFSYEWTDLAYQQILAGNTAIYVFPLCILLVFMVLAAQYESLTLPLAVILIVPVVLFSALFGVWLTRGDNNIFTQIGLMVLVGLACKNAILIVEFARELELQGQKTIEAALNASRLRLRPILMTSLAFIMGVMPLVFSTGAGAEMRTAIGIAVFSGMIGVTLFGLFLTPVFYVLVRKVTKEELHCAGEVSHIHTKPGKKGGH